MRDRNSVPPVVRRFLLRAGGWESLVRPIGVQHSLEQALEARYYLSDIIQLGWVVALSQEARYALRYDSPSDLGRGVALFLLDADRERIHLNVWAFDNEKNLRSCTIISHPTYGEVQRTLLRCQDIMDGYREFS
ncbi:TPA: hypothetical protein HA241_05910 [Candidatus Woesearchaeota archaeon]|nr:hypothetical protein [Candidatus Woesearchaeota archaeon]